MILLSKPAAVGAGWSLIQHIGQVGAAGGVTTAAIDTTGADLIVALVGRGDGAQGQPSMTDNQGNSYALAVSDITSPSGTPVWLFYVHTPVVRTGHTFSSNTPYGPLLVAAFKGSAAAPLDQTNHAYNAATSSLQPGSITPTQANELLISGCVTGANVTGVDSGFTVTDNIGFVSSVSDGGALAYLIETAIAARNPTWSLVSSAQISALIASFA
jgi:hypothetical protein